MPGEFRRIGVIMAGGAGERFWPVSTPVRPKQFLRLGCPDKSLLQQAVERAESLFSPSGTYIATGRPWADASRLECPTANVLAEPAKRNTTGCLVWAAANLMASFEDWSRISMAVLTADHRISPLEGFQQTVELALDTAETTGGLVTIGIRPNRPETGYGYVELGEAEGGAIRAKRFVEKPDMPTAESYLASGQYLWNSGMFFWTLPAFVSELEQAQPEAGAVLRELAGRLRQGEDCQAVFESLASVSIDYALMEKASRVFVVEAQFEWDDLGAWDSLRRSYPPDPRGNVALGETKLVDTSDSVVYVDGNQQEVCLLGVEGLVVVVTADKVMVCPADRAQEVRKLSQA